MSFLTAEWRKLAIANYLIDPAKLAPYVPFGTELDLWQGRCYASLIGFMFVNTRLKGIKVPFHVNFEEVNLRFYVKRKEGDEWRRGVVFIKEIVPKPAIALVANVLYNESYQALPMTHRWQEHQEAFEVEYRWKKRSSWQSFAVKAGLSATAIPAGSETEFITEHYWGYARSGERVTTEYEVTHPRWLAYEVQETNIEVDFALTYGEEFAFLNGQSPASVMLAEGSAITIEGKRMIRG
ncbi:MAG: DUF2071 domain-containing protein [Bacteroidia bacterium]|nr:DUF2071 domain-containing protein [Bacteroidia bacterium]